MVSGRAGEYLDPNLLASRLHLILVAGFFLIFALAKSKVDLATFAITPSPSRLICYSFDLIPQSQCESGFGRLTTLPAGHYIFLALITPDCQYWEVNEQFLNE